MFMRSKFTTSYIFIDISGEQHVARRSSLALRAIEFICYMCERYVLTDSIPVGDFLQNFKNPSTLAENMKSYFIDTNMWVMWSLCIYECSYDYADGKVKSWKLSSTFYLFKVGPPSLRWIWSSEIRLPSWFSFSIYLISWS